MTAKKSKNQNSLVEINDPLQKDFLGFQKVKSWTHLKFAEAFRNIYFVHTQRYIDKWDSYDDELEIEFNIPVEKEKRMEFIESNEWELEVAATKLRLPDWITWKLEFILSVHKMNLYSKMDLIETKEYRSILAHYNDRIDSLQNQILAFQDGSPVENYRSPLIEWLKNPELPKKPSMKSSPNSQIAWLGPVNQLATLFKWLEEQQLITKTWRETVKSLFHDQNGNPIGKNLSNLASENAVEKSVPLKKFKNNLEDDLTKRLRQTKED